MNRTKKVLLVIMVCAVLLLTAACGKSSAPFTHGTWSGDRTYTSEFFGFRFVLNIMWIPISDANLAKTAGIRDMSESSMKAHLDEGGTIYELLVMTSPSRSIIITVRDNKKNPSMSEKEFFDAGQTEIKGQYISAGYTCLGEKSSVNFLGKATDCVKYSTTKDGATMYYITVPVFKDNYTACVEFGSGDEADLSKMAAMASAI